MREDYRGSMRDTQLHASSGAAEELQSSTLLHASSSCMPAAVQQKYCKADDMIS